MKLPELFNALQNSLTGSKTKRYRELTREMFISLETLFEKLAADFNSTISLEPLMVTLRHPETKPGADQSALDLLRLTVSTAFWILSIKGSDGAIDFFILPATEGTSLSKAEMPSRAKLRLVWNEVSQSWSMDNLAVTEAELNTLMRSLLKDVITRSRDDFDLLPESTRLLAGGQSLTRSVRSLVADKNALVQKIVDQHEDIQNRIARELHDAVLGNVMLLKRSLIPGSRRIADEEMMTVLDEIATRLRDLCQDLSPRDLKDVGLQLMLEELCSTVSDRLGVECIYDCLNDIPVFPEEVSLHIYRIAQECFNNVAKHAEASKVRLRLDTKDGLFTMRISDDGRGFDPLAPPTRTKNGGSGTNIIKERAALIESIYPTRIGIESSTESGTTITLEILFAARAET